MFISLITGATKGFFGKKVSTMVSGTRGAALTNLIRMALLPGKTQTGETVPLKQVLLPIGLMSVCLFLNSYFKAFSTQYLSDAQLYPIYQAGGLILSALMGAVFFKEKVTVRCVIGLVLAFAAILLLK